MMRTVLSNEGHLFNQDERLIFSRYGKLSCESLATSSCSPQLTWPQRMPATFSSASVHASRRNGSASETSTVTGSASGIRFRI